MARRVPRTSSTMQWRASMTRTLEPSQTPNARRRQASWGAQPISTTVAMLPDRQAESAQVRGAATAAGGWSVGSGMERAFVC